MDNAIDQRGKAEDIQKRDFLKKGFFTILAGGALALFSSMPKTEAVAAIHETKFTISASGASATLDSNDGTIFDVTLTASCTFTFRSPPSGRTVSFTLILRQDGTGSRTATWPAAVKWASATAPTLSTAASSVDVLTFFTPDAGTTWYGFVAGKALS